MNDFFNGIFKIWEKLPDEGKSAFTDKLTIKEKSAVKIGKQLLEYYVDVSQDLKKREEERRLQEEELARQRKNKKGKKGSSAAATADSTQPNSEPGGSPLEAILKNLPPELVQAVMQNIAASMKPPAAAPQSDVPPPSKQPADEDVIDAEWTEITNDGKKVTRK